MTAIKILRPSTSVLDTAKPLVVSMDTKRLALSPETLSGLMSPWRFHCPGPQRQVCLLTFELVPSSLAGSAALQGGLASRCLPELF